MARARGRGDGLSSDVATPVGLTVAESMGSALRAVAIVSAVGAWTAPVGQALLGSGPGDLRALPTGEVEVLSIATAPEPPD